MRVSHVLLLFGAAGCHCLRDEPSGRIEVRFENKNKEFVQPNNPGRYVRTGVLSPRPDIIGPRDLARLAATNAARRPGRRAYGAEEDSAADENHYVNPGLLLDAHLQSQTDSALRHNIYVRGHSPTVTPSATFTVLTTRSLTTPRTQTRTIPPELFAFSSQNNPDLHSLALPDVSLPAMNKDEPPAEADLPTFGEGSADIAAVGEVADPGVDDNVPPITTGTNKSPSDIPVPKFRADVSAANPSKFDAKANANVNAKANAPKEGNGERMVNFVKFMNANKDLVDEYVKKKWIKKASKRVDRSQVQSAVATSWSINPLRKGAPSSSVPLPIPISVVPETTQRQRLSVTMHPASVIAERAAAMLTEKLNLRDYGRATTVDYNLLDLAPARGAAIANMRLKGRICQRYVLLPEGPKYNRHGSVYLAAFKPIYDKDFPQTRAPRMLLPVCCNCCRKSVLGCE